MPQQRGDTLAFAGDVWKRGAEALTSALYCGKPLADVATSRQGDGQRHTLHVTRDFAPVGRDCFRERPAAAEDVADVAENGAGGGGDDTDTAGEGGQGALAGFVEEPFGR